MHPSHKTRFSDSSLYDEVCIYCGITDRDTISARHECSAAPKMKIKVFMAHEYNFMPCAMCYGEPGDPSYCVWFIPGTMGNHYGSNIV